jgi:hypothetical protein
MIKTPITIIHREIVCSAVAEIVGVVVAEHEGDAAGIVALARDIGVVVPGCAGVVTVYPGSCVVVIFVGG